MISIKKVSSEQADEIIETRKPLGLFYTISDGVYVGIDNHYGDAWTEEFKSLSACKRWLNGGEIDWRKQDAKQSNLNRPTNT